MATARKKQDAAVVSDAMGSICPFSRFNMILCLFTVSIRREYDFIRK